MKNKTTYFLKNYVASLFKFFEKNLSNLQIFYHSMFRCEVLGPFVFYLFEVQSKVLVKNYPFHNFLNRSNFVSVCSIAIRSISVVWNHSVVILITISFSRSDLILGTLQVFRHLSATSCAVYQ